MIFRRHRPSRAAFTLVEMLVVMGIIAILLAVVVPAFGRFGFASRRSAVGKVMDALDQARMRAITDGRATYFVVAAPANVAINPALRGRAFAIFEDRVNLDDPPVQLTPWVNLPVGMAFKVTKLGSVEMVTMLLDGYAKAPDEFPLAGAIRSTNSPTQGKLPYLKFMPTGLVEDERPYGTTVLLFVGTVNENGVEVPGKAGANTRPEQLEQINVNAATGRATYVVNPLDNLASVPPTPAP